MSLEWKADTIGKLIADLGGNIPLWCWKLSHLPEDRRYAIFVVNQMYYHQFSSDRAALEFATTKAREAISLAAKRLSLPQPDTPS